jgi:hypothetical protein
VPGVEGTGVDGVKLGKAPVLSLVSPEDAFVAAADVAEGAEFLGPLLVVFFAPFSSRAVAMSSCLIWSRMLF